MLGVLGGMGPLATVDFMRKVIEATPATRDQDHLPMVVYSLPQVPDRTACILGRGPSPVPVMVEGIRALNRAGADCIAIPCNTAHYWFDDLAAAGAAPILHIVDAACAALERRGVRKAPVGLLATTGTIAAGIYQDRLAGRGYDCLTPSEDEQEDRVMAGIHEVKGGRLEHARSLLEAAAETLREQGAGAIVLGCTEIPVVLDDARYVDATRALAEACVGWFSGDRQAVSDRRRTR